MYFEMMGLMRGEFVKTQSDAAAPLDSILNSGVRETADVDSFAARSDKQLSILVWNYRDDDVSAPAAPLTLSIEGLPKEASRVLVNHYRIDQTHSNAYTAWKQLGSPEAPDPDQYKLLEAAGQLQLLESPKWIDIRGGAAALTFSLPLQGVSLVQLSWE